MRGPLATFPAGRFQVVDLDSEGALKARRKAPSSRPAPPAAAPLAARDDEQLAEVSFARAASGQGRIALQSQVNDTPVPRTHRVERHRLTALTCSFSEALSQVDQGGSASRPVVLRVYRQMNAGVFLARQSSIDEVLESVERLTTAPDEDAARVAVDEKARAFVVLADFYAALRAHQTDDFFKSLPGLLDRLLVHRLRSGRL